MISKKMYTKSKKIIKLKEINKRINKLIGVMETEIFIRKIDIDKYKNINK